MKKIAAVLLTAGSLALAGRRARTIAAASSSAR